MKFQVVKFSAAFLAAVVAAGSAAAQSLPPTVSAAAVSDAPAAARSDFEGRGIPAGSFMFYPSITAGMRYDDNIFASNTNRTSDWLFVERPELRLKSNWNRHSLDGYAWLEALQHAKFSTDNQVNGGIGASGVLDIQRDMILTANFQYARNHEERGTGESQTRFDKPVAYNQFDGGATLNKRFNRLWASFGGTLRRTDYEDPTVNGVAVSQSYRDGTVSTEVGRVGYEVSPMTSVFFETALIQRNFNDSRFNSTGYRMAGGVKFEPSRLLNGEFFAGYMSEDYKTAGFQKVSSFTYGGNLVWSATRLLNVTADGLREARESAYLGGVSMIDSQFGVKADYEIQRNLRAGGGLRYIRDDYNTTTRRDEYWQPSLFVKYLVTPNVAAGFDYKYTSFTTNGVGILGYVKSVYMVSLTAFY